MFRNIPLNQPPYTYTNIYIDIHRLLDKLWGISFEDLILIGNNLSKHLEITGNNLWGHDTMTCEGFLEVYSLFLLLPCFESKDQRGKPENTTCQSAQVYDMIGSSKEPIRKGSPNDPPDLDRKQRKPKMESSNT